MKRGVAAALINARSTLFFRFLVSRELKLSVTTKYTEKSTLTHSQPCIRKPVDKKRWWRRCMAGLHLKQCMHIPPHCKAPCRRPFVKQAALVPPQCRNISSEVPLQKTCLSPIVLHHWNKGKRVQGCLAFLG